MWYAHVINTVRQHILVCLALTSLTSIVLGQSPHDRIAEGDFNVPYLEYLIKIKVDEVRLQHGCSSLVNDSILYVASKFHAGYMSDNMRMTHFQDNSPNTRTPQQRAELFGAKNYQVGENVLKTQYNVTIHSKTGRDFDTRTYDALANSIVDGWVNSPGHFKNMTTAKYNITGISVSISNRDKFLYACQKFAYKSYPYTFYESKGMFPFSDYKPIIPKADFLGIEQKLLIHEHDWGVKHDVPDACAECKRIVTDPAPTTLRVEDDNFILRIENSDFVKKLIRKKRDGFAVEIVYFEDYMCGNPAYYTHPSRRNGQCKLNGTLLLPLYRNDLFRGYRKRKTNKEIHFLSYILKADSIPFFQRFYQYKLEKFSSEYFEIKLGRVPKDASSVWNHNLVYIQDQQICEVEYFTSYCGELFFDSTSTELLPLDTNGKYDFTLDTINLSFEIPFEKNNSSFTDADISPFIQSISKLDFTVDSVHIRASSSVEGDSILNEQLQQTRATNIVGVFQQFQSEKIHARVETFTGWKHFYQSLKISKEWNHLVRLDKVQLSKRLNQNLKDSLEQILIEERKASINLYCSVNLTDANLTYYIQKEYGNYCDSLRQSPNGSAKNERYLSQLHKLYKFCFRMVVEGKVDTVVLSQLPIPDYFNSNIPFSEKFILYGYAFPFAYAQNKMWQSNRDRILKAIMIDDMKQASAEFRFAFTREKTNELLRKMEVNQEEIQSVLDVLENLKPLYKSNIHASINIEKLNFNLNMILLNKSFVADPMANSAAAFKCLNEISSYYRKQGLMNDSLALQLAMLAVHYENVAYALHVLEEYMDMDNIHAYYMKLSFTHPSISGSTFYFDQLIMLSDMMSNYKWCNMFLTDCGIPFQSLDSEKLRDVFCQKCISHNTFIKSITQ